MKKFKTIIGKLNPNEYEKDELLWFYETMVKQRVFDENIVRMVSEGKVKGFYHAGAGEEAVGAGTCRELNDDDYIFYMHRGCNEMIAKGVPIDRLYADFFGNVHGTNKGLGAGIIHSAWPEKGVLGQPGTIGSNSTLGMGVALGIKYRESQQVVVSYFGDGTAAREPLHGALNWASLYEVPLILVCENNEYGLSTHVSNAISVNQHVAEFTLGYKNVQAIVVDGNDVLAVNQAMKEAVERARSGEGPTFIEALTYRHKGHFVGDPVPYMDKNRTQFYVDGNDPISNLGNQMVQLEIATQEELDEIWERVKAEQEKDIEEADKHPMPERERLWEGLWSDEYEAEFGTKEKVN